MDNDDFELKFEKPELQKLRESLQPTSLMSVALMIRRSDGSVFTVDLSEHRMKEETPRLYSFLQETAKTLYYEWLEKHLQELFELKGGKF